MGFKDSNIIYIGEIPSNWEVVKFKRIAKSGMGETILKERLDEDGFPVFSATEGDNVFGYLKNPTNILNPGDLIIPARGTIGHVKLVSKPCTSTQTTIYSKIKGINSKFLFYQALGLKDWWFEYDKTAIPQITVNQVQNNPLLLPPRMIQNEVVKKLDYHVDKINQLIQNQQQQIEKLKEYRQSLISEVVTNGIDPYVEFKDSGHECIGRIPLTWDFTKLLNILEQKITDGPHESLSLFDDGIPFISAEAIKNDKIDFNLRRGNISQGDYEKCCKKYVPQRNDIYMVKSGATTGNLAIVETDEIFTIWSPLAVIRSKKTYYYKYLFYFLKSDNFQKQVELNWTYGTQQNLSMRVLEKLSIVIPSFKEQARIANLLDLKTSKIDKLIEIKNMKIEELNSFKKSLIYEYVTGKKEVS